MHARLEAFRLFSQFLSYVFLQIYCFNVRPFFVSNNIGDFYVLFPGLLELLIGSFVGLLQQSTLFSSK